MGFLNCHIPPFNNFISYILNNWFLFFESGGDVFQKELSLSLFVFIASFFNKILYYVTLSSKIFCLHISGSFCKLFLFFWFHIYLLYLDSLSSSTFFYTAIWTKDYTWGLIWLYQQLDMVFQKFCLYSHNKCISQLIWNNFL